MESNLVKMKVVWDYIYPKIYFEMEDDVYIFEDIDFYNIKGGYL